MRKEFESFDCPYSLLGLHSTELEAPLGLTRWKRSDRQFLASQAEASAQGGPLAQEEMGGIPARMQRVCVLIFSYLQ